MRYESSVRNQFVRQMVKKVLTDSKIKDAPVDLRLILSAHGVGYEEVNDFPDTVDALIVEDGIKVYAAVNSRQHPHRQRFSLAHELGHYFLHRDGMPEDSVTIDSPPEETTEVRSKSPAESEADLFAGELLVPVKLLKLHAGKSIPELAKVFVVSEQVVSIAISRNMQALFK